MTTKKTAEAGPSSVRDLIRGLGGAKAVAAATGLTHKAVESHIQAGKIPSKWFWVFRDMADRADLPRPTADLFTFASALHPSASTQLKKPEYTAASAL